MRWQEDVKLMHEMGLDAYRFSIAWTRIIPGSTSYVLQNKVLIIKVHIYRPYTYSQVCLLRRRAGSCEPNGLGVLQQPN
jgi:beta-glucosidase/6-phospho-beta-glucosidase/beta-galactosidase